jgi:hypothetical protein
VEGEMVFSAEQGRAASRIAHGCFHVISFDNAWPGFFGEISIVPNDPPDRLLKNRDLPAAMVASWKSPADSSVQDFHTILRSDTSLPGP